MLSPAKHRWLVVCHAGPFQQTNFNSCISQLRIDLSLLVLNQSLVVPKKMLQTLRHQTVEIFNQKTKHIKAGSLTGGTQVIERKRKHSLIGSFFESKTSRWPQVKLVFKVPTMPRVSEASIRLILTYKVKQMNPCNRCAGTPGSEKQPGFLFAKSKGWTRAHGENESAAYSFQFLVFVLP